MKRTYIGLLLIIGLVALLLSPSPAFAQISLGNAQSFGVLAGQTVTNTGATTVNGNVGVSPGNAIVGFPPGIIVGGVQHAADVLAGQAQSDLTTAYLAIENPVTTPCNVDLSGQDLGGLTLVPGVYCFSAAAGLTGVLTLNLQGNPNAVFVFKTVSTLITATNSSVVLINSGGTTCPPNVYWKVGSSATLEVGSTFIGNVLALTSISMKTGARSNGRVLARNGSVTLDTNTVTACAPAAVCPVITVNPATLPNGTVGTVYNQTVSAVGGVAPYTFAVTSGALPTGLVLNAATGAITGTPLTTFTSNFTITATDANSCPGSRAYAMAIAAAAPCPVITVNPATLPAGFVGTAYNQTVSAVGGVAPYTFAVTSGALPTGLVLNAATGAITGTTSTTPGLFNFTITATDSSVPACPGTRAYALAIACPVITLSPATLPAGFVGTAFNQTISASGGTAPYTFSVANGALPNGLTLNAATGAITGTPTTTGLFNFTIRATDANGCLGSLAYAMAIAGPAPGGSTLDFVGLTILMVLLVGAGLFVMKRLSI